MRLLREKSGFVLVELIIATAILAAVIPLTKIFIDTIRVSNEAKIQQKADHLAQQYLEEYKAMDLDDLLAYTPPNEENVSYEGKDFIVSVAMTWIPIEVENLIGTVKITKIPENANGIKIELYNSEGEKVSYTENPYSSGKEYLLSLDDNYRLKWEDYSGVKISNVPAKGQLNLIVEGNPEIKVNLKNRLDSVKELIINKTEIIPSNEKSKFRIFIENGEQSDKSKVDINALIRDTEQVRENELGVNIIVTVKDTDGVELAKMAETRKIRW